VHDAIWRHAHAGPLSLGAVGVRGQLRDIHTSGSLRTPSTRDYSLAGFAVEEMRAGPVRLQGGLRYDWARFEPLEPATIFVGGRYVPVRPRTFGSVSGSLGGLLTVSEGVRVGASIARAYRTPDFNELYSDGPHLAANSYDVGDPDLDAEAGFGIDLFVRLQHDRLRGEVALFRNALDNYIFPSSRGRAELGRQAAPRFQYTNEDVLLSGAEGRVEWSVTRFIVIDATASAVYGKFTSERAAIPVISDDGSDTTFVPASVHPPLLPPVRGYLSIRHEHPRYFLEFATRMSAAQHRTGDFESPTAAYAIADCSAGYRFLVRDRLHSFTLRGENLLDANYRDHLSRTKAVMPEPGINVSLVYRLSF
jgi:iron complex outermembrane recepter protein